MTLKYCSEYSISKIYFSGRLSIAFKMELGVTNSGSYFKNLF